VGRLSHEVGWKYKAVVRALENKRRVRAILEVQKRNKLKVTKHMELDYIINHILHLYLKFANHNFFFVETY